MHIKSVLTPLDRREEKICFLSPIRKKPQPHKLAKHLPTAPSPLLSFIIYYIYLALQQLRYPTQYGDGGGGGVTMGVEVSEGVLVCVGEGKKIERMKKRMRKKLKKRKRKKEKMIGRLLLLQ